jgi:hypothetical protein
MNNMSHFAFDPKQVAMYCGRDNPWAIRDPRDEARDLYRMVVHGSCTLEGIRDLIAVPREIESALLGYAERYPEDEERIHTVLMFRRRVGAEFERLVQCKPSLADLHTRHESRDMEEAESAEYTAEGVISVQMNQDSQEAVRRG